MIPFSVVDAFTDTPFTGNPAGVCLLDEEPPAAWMAAVAAEANLSETAFCWPERGGTEPGVWRLRWFTPRVEVPLCGHATLATARVMLDTGRAQGGQPIAFETLSGRLTALAAGDTIQLDFPAQPPSPAGPDMEGRLARALGVEVTYAGASAGASSIGTGPRAGAPAAGGGRRLMAVTAGAGAVRSARPDLAAVAALDYQGVILTSAGADAGAGGDGADYVMRYFAPNAGIPEDPVTGSAQCTAGPYWAERTGRRSLVARQVSARGGTLYVEVGGGRVAIAGHAVVSFTGHLTQPPPTP